MPQKFFCCKNAMPVCRDRARFFSQFIQAFWPVWDEPAQPTAGFFIDEIPPGGLGLAGADNVFAGGDRRHF